MRVDPTKIAAHSKAVDRAEERLKQKWKKESKLMTAEGLIKAKKAIDKRTERFKSEREPLKDRIVKKGLPSDVNSKYVLKLMRKIEQEASVVQSNLKGRFTR